MKTLITILFTFLISFFCYSQNKLDTTWNTNNYKFRVILERNEDSSGELNTKMTLYRDNQLLLSDSLFCSYLMADLGDINGDSYDDLRIYQSSGARANETFNLYLFQKPGSVFKKVKGFEEWPNLHPTKAKGILASTILTGTVEYHFFKLEDNGDLIDLNVSEEDYNLDGKEFVKGLRKAKKLQKQSKKQRTTESFMQEWF